MIELRVSPDLYEIDETFRSLDSKFVNGKMMADGPGKRFDNAPARVQVLGTLAEAEERDILNELNNIKKILGGLSPVIMKTKEQRQAELQEILK